MNTILVAYYTKGGATKEYAQTIYDTLKAHKLTVELHNLADGKPQIEAYDTIILGAGVRMFMVYRAMKKILKQKAVQNKELYLFLSAGMALDEPKEAVEKFLKPLAEKYNITPTSMISLPGKIPEKWVEKDSQKDPMKPDLAQKWAEEIIEHLKG